MSSGIATCRFSAFCRITFTVIYTIETAIKALSRGFILADYTYLRDMWNWLDICVLVLAYLMFVSTEIGNMTSIRTLRVLRALKSVTALPGESTVNLAVCKRHFTSFTLSALALKIPR